MKTNTAKANIHVPRQIRGQLEPEWNNISEKVENFYREIQNKVTEICDNNENVSKVFLHYKQYPQTDNYLIEIVWRDYLLAIVYDRRTEFNIQEATFFLYPETFKRVSEFWKEWQRDHQT